MQAKEADFLLNDFHFASGETLSPLKIRYRTLGSPQRGASGEISNAVLLLHGTTGSGKQFLKPATTNALFEKGQPLDVEKYFVILPDGIGHGGSSKPSDGMRSRFPKYAYEDMVQAQYRLVTEGLGIKKLRLILGTSMGGMHTWMWGEQFPEVMQALLPIACVPGPVKGRNLLWRRMLVDSITADPGFHGGDYDKQPQILGVAWNFFKLMADGAAHLEGEIDSIASADDMVKKAAQTALEEEDANDVVYEFAASKDYDPSGALEKIKAPLLAVNFADDELNPAELGVLDAGARNVWRARTVLVPAGEKSKGHQTLQVTELWAPYVRELLEQTVAQTEG